MTTSTSPVAFRTAKRLVAGYVFVQAFLWGAGVQADGFIYVSDPGVEIRVVPHPRVRRARPHFPLQVTRHKVTAEIDENLARTRVEETFHNPGPRQLEGTYFFPLPPAAAVTGFTMKMGGTEVAGEILEKDKARQIYEDIVRRVKDPGLLEYVDRGLFRARVFPIPARGNVDVAIEYSETLPRSRGVATYRYPLDTGKYSAGNYKNVVIDVQLRSAAPLRTVHCPTHEAVGISRPGNNKARVTLEAKELRADKDFVLTWNVSEDALAPVLLAHRGSESEGFFYLSVMPKPQSDVVVPKDIVFVIDTSGSMLGPKLEQVQRALRYCIHNLNEGDRFNVVDFSTEARRFREGLTVASEENRKLAGTYVDGFKARGGTNIEEGLRFAAQALGEPEKLQMVVLLTDGEPTIGVTSPPEIISSLKKANAAKRRVFVFGVGEDLNAKLLDAVAKETRGVTEYIRSKADIEVPLANFYDKIDSPVLTDLRIELPGGGGASDLFPRPIPDLFRGDQLDIFGRYDPGTLGAGGHKTVIVRGRYLGKERVFEYSLPFKGEGHAYVPRLWAMSKVGYLLEQMRLSGESKEVKEEVIRLSKRYGIITPYTSYLIVEEEELTRPTGRPQPLSAVRNAARDALAPVTGAAAQEAVDLERREYRAQRGADGVSGSRRLRSLAKAKAGASVDSFLAGGINVGALRVQRIEGWTFYLQGNRWIDATLTDRKASGKLLEDTEKLRRVKYLSDEYFALSREGAAVGKLLAIGPEVTFLWKGQVVSVEL